MNGSSFNTPSSEPSWVTFSPYYETLSLTNTSTGFQATIPDIGAFDIPVHTTPELDRVVSYVTVRFLAFESWTYCEEIFIHSVTLDWAGTYIPIDPDMVTWHDDCSNTTQFVRDDSFNVDWFGGWTVSSGDLTSTDGYLEFTSMPTGTWWHGPIFVHTLDKPFVLSELDEFKVDLELINNVATDLGRVYVYLADSDYLPAVRVGAYDNGFAVSQGSYGAVYDMKNATQYVHGALDPYSYTHFRGNISFQLDSSQNLIADVDGFGSSILQTLDEVEGAHELKYIVVMSCRHESNSYMPSRIHDINLEYNNGPPNTTWHHDCSNTTAFDGVADDTWYGNPNVHVDGSISSTSGYIYADDYGSGTVSYGPMMYHTFSTPFSVSDFNNIDVEIEMGDSSATELAGAAVVLFDDNQDPVITINVADAWGGYSTAAVYVSYDFSNGTRYLTPYERPDSASTPYHDVIHVGLNSTGFFASIPRIGNFSLLDFGSIEQDRIISYIAVNFRASAGSPISETNRIHDILLNYEPSIIDLSPSNVWHHDCSNTSQLIYNDTFPLPWLTGINEWDITSGDMLSSGDHLYFENIPSASSGWHGPLWTHEFEDPFSLNQLQNFTVDLAVDNSLAAYGSKIQIVLTDSDYRPVLRAYIGDAWNALTQGSIFAEYMESDGTYYRHGLTTVGTFTSFDGVMMFTYDESEGVSAYVEGYGSALLYSPTSSELQRSITHVVILTGRLAGYSYMPSLVDDIYVEWLPDVPESYISSPDDLEFESGMTGNEITWSLSAEAGDPYTIYLDDAILESGVCDSQTLTVNADGFSAGSHNVTVRSDTPGGVVVDTVWVSVHPSTAPTINHPLDVEYEVGDTGNIIDWQPYDLYPASFELSINSVLDASGDWGGSSFVVDVDGHGVGTYEYSLSVFDEAGNEGTDIVMVTVVDSPEPEDDPTIDHPLDITYNVGETGNNITWTPYSTMPSQYELYVNGEIVDDGVWTGDQIVIDVDGLGVGLYNYTIRVFNTLGDYATDEVLVVVLGETADGDLIILSISIGSITVIIVVIGVICRRRPGESVGPSPSYDW